MSNKSRQRDISKALKAFPKLVKQKEVAFRRRKRFVEKTFGKLARRLNKRVRKSGSAGL